MKVKLHNNVKTSNNTRAIKKEGKEDKNGTQQECTGLLFTLGVVPYETTMAHSFPSHLKP